VPVPRTGRGFAKRATWLYYRALVLRYYSPSFKKDFVLSLIAFIAILGPFPTDDVQFLILKLVGCDEELLKLFPDRL
jgi:hypothetical protein